jgi:prepilin-type processing-associated H-X9-DG protein
MFRCTLDRDDSERIAENTDGQGIYAYSYSMTSIGNNTVNHGMTLIINKTTGLVLPFKLSGVRRPAGKIMIAEEQATKKAGEASDPARNVINDGRWAPPGDALSMRHNGRANVGFADGHCEGVKPSYATNLVNCQPDLQ